ncbi:MAG: hypothetical protein UW17_C0005G0005 [Candidatus Nomurabacteria bacterium GW2011_GWD1_44_10]|nr:MAG: hypothetical protein UW17_C0005G0005 [Candidatus Nomurabacteria bacterium GW2011_GWD1_44_10]
MKQAMLPARLSMWTVAGCLLNVSQIVARKMDAKRPFFVQQFGVLVKMRYGG